MGDLPEVARTRARSGHTEERIEMAAAVEELLSITIHKLKRPDFRTNF
jgi:hypothetical protein